ncbi:MAG: hypothetical protein AVDCRST_MAG79-3038, partial [uncultured Thermoleophilia bacterium]
DADRDTSTERAARPGAGGGRGGLRIAGRRVADGRDGRDGHEDVCQHAERPEGRSAPALRRLLVPLPVGVDPRPAEAGSAQLRQGRVRHAEGGLRGRELRRRLVPRRPAGRTGPARPDQRRPAAGLPGLQATLDRSHPLRSLCRLPAPVLVAGRPGRRHDAHLGPGRARREPVGRERGDGHHAGLVGLARGAAGGGRRREGRAAGRGPVVPLRL